MKALIWILRAYLYVIYAWVILSWLYFIPGVALIEDLLTLLVYPVMAPFAWLAIGPISLAPIPAVFILNWAINSLEARYGDNPEDAAPPPPDNRGWEAQGGDDRGI
ncbi:hypothetical protein KDL44_12030 [bacterium]|nr:hypothetical protein [bacterium]